MQFLAISTALAVIAIGAPAQTTAPATHKTVTHAVSTAKKTPATKTSAKSTAKSTATKSTAAKSTVKPTTKTSAVSTVHPKARVSSKTGASTQANSTKLKQQPIAARRPPTQQQPAPDRLKAIQQALADKGYFQGTPDGTWGPDSTEALKRFQRQENLDADGKLSALSLMALGLGPRRGTTSGEPGKTPEAGGAVAPIEPPPIAQPQP